MIRYIAPCDGSGLIVELVGDERYDSACLGCTRCGPRPPAPRRRDLPADPFTTAAASELVPF